MDGSVGNSSVVVGTITKIGHTSWETIVKVRWPNGTETEFELPYLDKEMKVGDAWRQHRETRNGASNVG